MSALKSRRPVTADEAIARLEAMCARAEHCTFELREKLWQWSIPTAEADKIIEQLKKTRYVDDARFARAFVNDKVHFARRGRLRIKQALEMKRIDADIIADALAEIDPEIYSLNLAYTLKQKAASFDDISDYETRMKLLRFAVQRGYEPSLAAKAINALRKDS
jgi:regulatory protein